MSPSPPPEFPELQSLGEAFRAECSQHLEATADAVAACRNDPDDPAAWRAAYQELDSLANAARAVNDAPTEAFGRLLALVSRRARDHAELRGAALPLIGAGIERIAGSCLRAGQPHTAVPDDHYADLSAAAAHLLPAEPE